MTICYMVYEKYPLVELYELLVDNWWMQLFYILITFIPFTQYTNGSLSPFGKENHNESNRYDTSARSAGQGFKKFKKKAATMV